VKSRRGNGVVVLDTDTVISVGELKNYDMIWRQRHTGCQKKLLTRPRP